MLPTFRSCFFILSLGSTIFAGLARGETNWPQFRGPGADGHSAATGLPVSWSEQDNVVWKTAIPGRGWSSPVIWGDQIWMGTATPDGKLMSAVCVHRVSGKILHNLPLFENEKPRFCHAMNSYASPTPVIEDGRVYIHFGSYGTACLDTSNGETLWARRDLPCDHFRGPGSSPILYKNMVVIHYDGFDFQYVVALDKKTGDTIWKRDRDIDFGTDNGDIFKAYCTPIVIQVNGKPQLISPASKATLAYDPETGKELWRVRYTGFSATAQPLFGHGMVFINTGFGKADMVAVRPDGSGDVTESHVKWHVKKSLGSKPSQVLVGDLIFNVSDAGVGSCLDAKTGETVWTKRIGGKYSSSLLAADGRVYYLSHEGKATVIKAAREYTELASNQLDDGFMASPAVTGKSGESVKPVT